MSKLFSVSEVELSYKSKVNPSDRPQIISSHTAYDVLLSNWSNHIELVEECNILLLNRANRVLAFFNVSKGGHTGTVVDAKVVFTAALKLKSCSVIISHNHPSGRLVPSKADLELTKKLVAGGKLLDISVLDHLIVTKYGYYSFADEGKIDQ